MKILHLTDVHGDISALERFVKFAQGREDIDAVTCSGDLAGDCLDKDKAKFLMQAYFGIRDAVRVNGSIAFSDLVEHILKDNAAPEELKKLADGYNEVDLEYDSNSRKHYEQLFDLFTRVERSGKKVMIVPGNHDCKAFFDYAGGMNLHFYTDELQGIKFAGCGEAPQSPSGIPPTRTIGFSTEKMFDFLSKEQPDVALVHNPPYGLQDRIQEGEEIVHWGDHLMLAYIRAEDPKIVLCGHCHNDFGASRDGVTWVLNSGNFGSYFHSKSSGNFSEVELDKEGVIAIRPYQIIDEEAVKQGDYPLRK